MKYFLLVALIGCTPSFRHSQTPNVKEDSRPVTGHLNPRVGVYVLQSLQWECEVDEQTWKQASNGQWAVCRWLVP